MNLTQAPQGQKLSILGIQTINEVTLRLQEMGVVRGAEVFVQQHSLFNGPLILRVGPSFLAIRYHDAIKIEVGPL